MEVHSQMIIAMIVIFMITTILLGGLIARLYLEMHDIWMETRDLAGELYGIKEELKLKEDKWYT